MIAQKIVNSFMLSRDIQAVYSSCLSSETMIEVSCDLGNFLVFGFIDGSAITLGLGSSSVLRFTDTVVHAMSILGFDPVYGSALD